MSAPRAPRCRFCGTRDAAALVLNRARRSGVESICRPCKAAQVRDARAVRRALGRCVEFGCTNPAAPGRGSRCDACADSPERRASLARSNARRDARRRAAASSSSRG